MSVVHPRETCYRRRPFSGQSRSRRPWRDFLRGFLTFCLGMPAAAAAAAATAGCDRLRARVLLPVQDESLCGASESGRLAGTRHGGAVSQPVRSPTRHNLIQLDVHCRLSNQDERSNPQGRCRCDAACLRACMCMKTGARIRCASPKLRRINASFTDCRKRRHKSLPSIIYVKNRLLSS